MLFLSGRLEFYSNIVHNEKCKNSIGGIIMIFNSYIVSDTKTAISMPLLGSQACPPPED